MRDAQHIFGLGTDICFYYYDLLQVLPTKWIWLNPLCLIEKKTYHSPRSFTQSTAALLVLHYHQENGKSQHLFEIFTDHFQLCVWGKLLLTLHCGYSASLYILLVRSSAESSFSFQTGLLKGNVLLWLWLLSLMVGTVLLAISD